MFFWSWKNRSSLKNGFYETNNISSREKTFQIRYEFHGLVPLSWSCFAVGGNTIWRILMWTYPDSIPYKVYLVLKAICCIFWTPIIMIISIYMHKAMWAFPRYARAGARVPWIKGIFCFYKNGIFWFGNIMFTI